jgi:ABC-type lipoprotein export system ATPase subunit
LTSSGPGRNDTQHTVSRNIYSIKIEYENNKYVRYLSSLSEWQKELDMIEGALEDESGRGSISCAQKEVDYINNKLQSDLAKLKDERASLIQKIYKEIAKEKSILLSIYSPIEERLKAVFGENKDQIEFKANILLDPNFASDFLSQINQSTLSEYRGLDEGKGKLLSEIGKTDFNNEESTLDFVHTVLDNVSKKENLDKTEQLLKGKSNKFYDFICSLSFITPNFSLTMGGRSLQELSPGERGIVLLIFYMVLSNNNLPLIIDQPEDNLDNQSIFTKLVPCIKAAKKDRQIIVVTHNPNIAVACDSEQIIYSEIDKKSNKVTYESGSIENPTIKKRIIDILEGTKLAFDFRKIKYEGQK